MTAARGCPVCGAEFAYPCRSACGKEMVHRHQLRDAQIGAEIEISVSLHRRLEEVATAAGVSIYVAIEWAVQQALSKGRWNAPPIVSAKVHRNLVAAVETKS